MDAHPKVVQLAEALPAEAWKPLERLTRYEIATEPRRKPCRIKEAIVRFKGYPNKKLIGETVAEFDYQPLKCGRSYRLVAFGEAPARVRGTITAIGDGSITVEERDGRTFTLKTGPYTTYADVVPSSLDAIKLNDYIGTAIKGPMNHWIAVEIVIIPESMRAGRKGYAAWDRLPDTSGTTATNMTNGLVSSVSPATLRTGKANSSGN